jgi:hypothetical protein
VLAYLNNVAKKREKERAAASVPDTPATPLTPVAPPIPAAQAPDSQTPVQSIELVPEQDVITEAEFDKAQHASEPENGGPSTLFEQPADRESRDEAQPSQDQEVCIYQRHISQKRVCINIYVRHDTMQNFRRA